LTHSFPDPEKFLRKKLGKAASSNILENLGFESLWDIHLLFPESSQQASAMANRLYAPLDFTAIAGAPHDIPEKAIDRLPAFSGDNAVSIKSHLQAFETVMLRFAPNHADVHMRLFVLSLEGDALNWFRGLAANSYKTLKELQDGFVSKWGEQRDNRYLLAALSTVKKNEK